MKIIFTLVSAIIALTLVTKTFAQEDGDWQVWGSVSAEKNLSQENLKLVLEEETRWEDDFNKFSYQAFDAGLVYGPVKWLDLGANFRYVLQDDAGNWEHESRPHVNATLKWQWLDLDFSNRSRFEYRYLTRTKDTWRYRNLTAIKSPLNLTPIKLCPFLKQESFFKTDQDNYNENRLSAGLEYTLIKNLKGDLFYLLRALKNDGDWINNNVVGVSLNFIF